MAAVFGGRPVGSGWPPIQGLGPLLTPERPVETVRYRAPKSEIRTSNYLGLLFLRIAHRPYVAMNLPATASFATNKDGLAVTEPKATQRRSTVSATIKASQT